MQRSLFAAISGLTNHQTRMDAIGNNIANVNTTAFKSSRVRFADILSQTLRGATAPQANKGGINSIQVGLGMEVSAIDNDHTQGSLQSTGRATDMAIQGSGFFIVNDGTQDFYTRDGSFSRGSAGYLINTGNGFRLMGWVADAAGNIDTMAPLTGLNIPLGLAAEVKATTEMTFGGNLNAAVVGTAAATATAARAVATTYTDPPDHADAVVAANDVATVAETAAVPGATAVDVAVAARAAAATFTVFTHTAEVVAAADAVADAAEAVAGAHVLQSTVFDSLGNMHTLTVTFTKDAVDNTWDWEVVGTSTTPPVITDGTGEILFTTAGTVDTGGAATITITPGGGAADLTVDLDFTSLTQLVGGSDVLMHHQDGFPMGTLHAFDINAAGIVTGAFDNGMTVTLGQIALSRFENPEGLNRSGGNMFDVSASSGEPFTGTPATGGRGIVRTATLEMSNVNMAFEFTEMITTSRAFQANSRVITSSNELLQEVVNLVR